MIEYLLGGVVIAFNVVLIVGALTGRVRVRGCCSIADPNQDLRIRNGGGAGT